MDGATQWAEAQTEEDREGTLSTDTDCSLLPDYECHMTRCLKLLHDSSALRLEACFCPLLHHSHKESDWFGLLHGQFKMLQF